jgi:site-specific DNA recombinase
MSSSASRVVAARVRTREQKMDKARRGEIADGRVLGYRTIGEAKARRREVDPEQAEIVRRIFTMAAAGKGLLKIARTLNTEGVVNPCGQARGGEPESARRFWAGSGIRAILHRETYVGRVTYGATKNMRRGGRRFKVRGENPVTVDRPDLESSSPRCGTALTTC